MRKHMLLAVMIAFVSALAFTSNAHAQSRRSTDVDVRIGRGGVSVDIDIHSGRGHHSGDWRRGCDHRRSDCGHRNRDRVIVVPVPRDRGCDRGCDDRRFHRPETIMITVDWYVPPQRWWDGRRQCWRMTDGYWTVRDVRATWDSYEGGYVWYDSEGRRMVRRFD